MRKIKFLKEPGYIFDIFFLFTLKFNLEYFLANGINYNKANEDTEYYRNVLKDFSPIPDDLRIFFHLSPAKKSFMSYYYFEPYVAQLLYEKYNLRSVLDLLSNEKEVSKKLIKFYFNDIDEKTLEECQSSLPALNKLIKESKYSGDIKSALYSYFIDPSPYIRELCYQLMQKDLEMDGKRKKCDLVLDELQREFNFDALSSGFKQNPTQTTNIDFFDDVFVSFCFYNKNLVKLKFPSRELLLMLGRDYQATVTYFATKTQIPDLEVFGNAISETNRINILMFIAERGEITIKDIEQEFGFTGTNSYYHLSIMIKAGMLKTRNSGRTVLYSINKDYFKSLCSVLGEYGKN